jgi:hypothetical protein
MRTKKCPPGIICLENITLMIFLIGLLVIGYLIYINLKNNNKSNNNNQDITLNHNERIVIDQQVPFGQRLYNLFGVIPSYPYNNLGIGGGPSDVLLNPYAAPLRDERYFMPEINVRPTGTIPINVSTNIGAVDTNYRQMGIITPLNGQTENNILPLMGRPLFTNRAKWQYYTISNQHNNVKLPISFKGKSALSDYGVDQIFSGDTIYVEGYNEPFTVTVYENDTIKYLPFV